MSYIIKNSGWLIFFYSTPSKPVSSRVKVWRRLLKAGALPFKGAVYILPYSNEHYEFFQWLVSEVASLGGESAFVKAERIDSINDNDIISLFNQARERDYLVIERHIDALQRKIENIKKGGVDENRKKLLEDLYKCEEEFEVIKRIDFFSSTKGRDLQKRLKSLRLEIKNLSKPVMEIDTHAIRRRRIEDYQGKLWLTRKNPFVDRMASAWLIRKFIDKDAKFCFIDEKEKYRIDKDSILFDAKGGEFTHFGDMCTFEVLLKSFNIKDKSLKKIAEIVHEIDLKDEKYNNPETRGIEDILIGIRKTSKNDSDALERGIAIFEMLYASKTG